MQPSVGYWNPETHTVSVYTWSPEACIFEIKWYFSCTFISFENTSSIRTSPQQNSAGEAQTYWERPQCRTCWFLFFPHPTAEFATGVVVFCFPLVFGRTTGVHRGIRGRAVLPTTWMDIAAAAAPVIVVIDTTVVDATVLQWITCHHLKTENTTSCRRFQWESAACTIPDKKINVVMRVFDACPGQQKDTNLPEMFRAWVLFLVCGAEG